MISNISFHIPTLIYICSMNSFMKMPDAYVELAKAVHRTGKRFVKNHKYDAINIHHRPNVAVVPLYLKGQAFPLHRDNVYTPDGKFDTSKNSQQKDSIVYGVSIGATRTLIMQLMRHPTKREKLEKRNPKPVPIRNRNAIYKFILAHGSLFILHPADEELRHRAEHSGCKTFWQHKVETQDEMTLGVVLRTCTHFREVDRTTGVLHLSTDDKAKESKYFKQNYKMLLDYFSSEGDTRKKEKDDEIMSGWANIKGHYRMP